MQIHLTELQAHIGRDLGHSDWLEVTQEHIDSFASLTGDDQWIHVDEERAKREMGGTVAHGLLTLSMLTSLALRTPVSIQGGSRRINYGFDRVRFTNFVPSGARVRLHQTLASVSSKPGGVLVSRHSEVEVEGHDKPALVADWLTLFCE
jgi:acyl dehydratase